jgi:hypothetical protein
MTQPTGPSISASGRHLPYVGFAIVVIAYLAIIQVGGLLISNAGDVDEADAFVSTHNVLLVLWIPVGASLAFTYAVAWWLGWLRPVLHDDQPVNRWVWVVPIIFAVGIAGTIDYPPWPTKVSSSP